MKKIYNAPEITVVNLKTTNSLLTNSITFNSTDGDVDASQAATRGARFSSWDDEEE